MDERLEGLVHGVGSNLAQRWEVWREVSEAEKKNRRAALWRSCSQPRLTANSRNFAYLGDSLPGSVRRMLGSGPAWDSEPRKMDESEIAKARPGRQSVPGPKPTSEHAGSE